MKGSTMSGEPVSSTAAGFAIGKAIAASPGAIGVLGGALGFMFLWPKTAKEGFCRLAVSGLSSHFFGDAVLRTIVKFADWIPPEEIRAGAYLIAALPAWWILGLIIKNVSEAKSLKDVKEIV